MNELNRWTNETSLICAVAGTVFCQRGALDTDVPAGLQAPTCDYMVFHKKTPFCYFITQSNGDQFA